MVGPVFLWESLLLGAIGAGASVVVGAMAAACSISRTSICRSRCSCI